MRRLVCRSLTAAISELRSDQRDGSDPGAQRHLGFFLSQCVVAAIIASNDIARMDILSFSGTTRAKNLPINSWEPHSSDTH